MSDLISRSTLLEELNSFSMRITGSADAMALVVINETRKSIMRMVEEQPTAFDLEGVIEELEKNKELAYNRHMDCSSDIPVSVYVRYSTQYRERESCLEILKSGITVTNGKIGGF